MNSEEKIPVGVSSCLLGEKVRYDGGHKRNTYIINDLGDFFDYRPFCPEMAAGMGVPRQTIHLIETDEGVRCVNTDDESIDVTDKLLEVSQAQRAWQQSIYAYILKKDSPSCGMERVKVYKKGQPTRNGVGIYAQELLQAFPAMPIEEEGRLNDATLRENFINRVLIYYRWCQLQQNDFTLKKWTDFHAQHKWIFFSHNQVLARKLGRFLSEVTQATMPSAIEQYTLDMMDLLKLPATRRNHSNVLQHIQGFLKNQLSTNEKQELGTAIHDYREGLLPLIVPVSLLRHHFLNHPNEYMTNSFYLNPHPKSLKLLNHI